MFRCALCAEVVPPRTAAHRLVVEVRPHLYPHRPHAQTVPNPPDRRVPRRKRRRVGTDVGGVGQAIVREVLICPACAPPTP